MKLEFCYPVIPPHKKRDIFEYEDLQLKIDKLKKFITSNDFKILISEEEQLLMRIQLSIMISYASILKERIDKF